MTTRAEVVDCARTWLGTPFQHQARLKGAGVDCAGLVIGVARELGLVAPAFDVNGYSRAPDGTLLGWCDAHMQRLPAQTSACAGDVIVVALDADPQHLGILADYRHGGRSIIHSSSTPQQHGGRVIETRLMLHARMRFVAAYALPGVA